jgi:hypothetical protein
LVLLAFLAAGCGGGSDSKLKRRVEKLEADNTALKRDVEKLRVEDGVLTLRLVGIDIGNTKASRRRARWQKRFNDGIANLCDSFRATRGPDYDRSDYTVSVMRTMADNCDQARVPHSRLPWVPGAP